MTCNHFIALRTSSDGDPLVWEQTRRGLLATSWSGLF